MVANAISELPRRDRRKLRRTAKKAIALTLTGLVIGGGFTGLNETFQPSVQAHALAFGPGIWSAGGQMFAGGYRHANGLILYCLELGLLPDDTNSSPALSAKGTLPAYSTPFIIQNGVTYNNIGAGALSSSSDQYKRLAYLLGKYGQTTNNQQAAALALAVWSIRGEVGATGDYHTLLAAERASAGSGAANQADSMLSEAAAWVASGGTGDAESTNPAGAPVLSASTPYSGTLSVKKGTSKVTLTNAVFEDGSNEKVWANGVDEDVVLNWSGRPPVDAEFGRYYRVSVSGETVYTTVTETDGTIYATQGDAYNQSTGYAEPGERKVETHTEPFEDTYIDPDVLWAPQLTTEVPSEFVKKGERFADTVTFFASESEPYAEWRVQYRTDGSKAYAPIHAKGTLYGPFATDPALNPQGTPPAGAPVAATAEITTDVDKGPGTYEVTSEVAKESGYYTWVWNINYEEQAASVINPGAGDLKSSLPDNYFFTDGFGQATEGQTVPTSIKFSTELSEDKVKMGGTLTDEIDIELVDGLWLRGEDGNRLPFTLEGTVYTSKKKPVQQSQAPEGARKVSTLTLTVDDTGKVVSEEFTAPVTDHDWLTVQWCVKGDSQPGASKGKVEDFCDDYGVPSETAKIEKPKVTTQAQEKGAVYGKIKDTAFVEGAMPDLPAEVDFTAYLKPEVGQPKYDENWRTILDSDGKPVLWTAEEVSNPAAVCEAQPVAKTDAVKVNGVGSYDSPEVTTKSDGTVYWVEELFVEDPETKEKKSVHRGKCGLPNETTIVEKPTVTTQAQEVGAVKGDIHDVAIVEGLIPEAPTSVDFTLFLKPEVGQPKYDESWKPILDDEGNQVLWTAEEITDPAAVCEAQPVAKTDRVDVDAAGEYKSPAVRAETEGTGYWVEELFVEDPETGEDVSLHRGECGLPNETTVIERPTVTTKAVDEASVGDKIFDTAIVAGPLSEREEISYEVTFEAYHRAAEDGPTTGIDEALCTVDTKVWETDKATPVTTAGEYRSEKWKLEESHIGEILWVETLWEIEQSDEGEIRSEIHRGACGEENEITKVNEKPELAFTGSAFGNSALVAGLLLLLVGGGLAFAHRRKPEASILD